MRTKTYTGVVVAECFIKGMAFEMNGRIRIDDHS